MTVDVTNKELGEKRSGRALDCRVRLCWGPGSRRVRKGKGKHARFVLERFEKGGKTAEPMKSFNHYEKRST